MREEVAYFMRRLYIQRLTTTSGGNISVKSGDVVLITPSTLDKGRITGEQIGVMDMDGNMITENLKPSIETRLHLEIYRKRPDVAAAVHAHPLAASAYAASTRKINTALLAESYAIIGEIAYAGYHCIGTSELARETAAAVSAANCVIMKNHGALAVGKTLLEAFDRLEVLENTARLNLICESVFKDSISPLARSELHALDALMGRA
jgi:L-fuculose-phosphate aldolase